MEVEARRGREGEALPATAAGAARLLGNSGDKDRLPGDLSVVMLGRKAATWQTIPYVRADDDGSYPEDSEEAWVGRLQFRGRSVHRLREELAKSLRLQLRVLDLVVCIRAGRDGRLTPLVVNLPRDGHGYTIEIVIIMDGTPGSAALRHPDINANKERSERKS